MSSPRPSSGNNDRIVGILVLLLGVPFAFCAGCSSTQETAPAEPTPSQVTTKPAEPTIPPTPPPALPPVSPPQNDDEYLQESKVWLRWTAGASVKVSLLFTEAGENNSLITDNEWQQRLLHAVSDLQTDGENLEHLEDKVGRENIPDKFNRLRNLIKQLAKNIADYTDAILAMFPGIPNCEEPDPTKSEIILTHKNSVLKTFNQAKNEFNRFYSKPTL